MKKFLFNSLLLILAVFSIIILTTACEDDSDSNNEKSTTPAPAESKTYSMSPAVSPKGVGVDFESDSSYGFDNTEIPGDWTYDIHLQTIKGVKTNGTSKGCPFIKLYKTTAKGYKYSLTGDDNFSSIKFDDVQESELVSDLVEEINDSDVVNTDGKYDYNLLNQYYVDNFVTKNSDNWLPADWTIGEDEVIFIIKTEEGNYYKLIVLGMGTTEGSMPGSGLIELKFEKL